MDRVRFQPVAETRCRPEVRGANVKVENVRSNTPLHTFPWCTTVPCYWQLRWVNRHPREAVTHRSWLADVHSLNRGPVFLHCEVPLRPSSSLVLLHPVRFKAMRPTRACDLICEVVCLIVLLISLVHVGNIG